MGTAFLVYRGGVTMCVYVQRWEEENNKLCVKARGDICVFQV